MTTTVSLVILTFGRWQSVQKSLTHNLKNAGYPIRELIHVDNGSGPLVEAFRQNFKPNVQVLHDSNRGVAVGYNRGFALATSSHVAITGCDRLMPDNWLAQFVHAIETIPETAAVSCYSGEHPERTRGAVHSRGDIEILPAIPFEARIHSKAFLFDTGFWREDFGLYGFEDAEWSDRAEKVAKRTGKINYVIPSMGRATHLPDDDGLDVGGKDYRVFKKETHADPRRRQLWRWCHHHDSPYYNPYARVELDLLDKASEGMTMIDNEWRAEQARKKAKPRK